MSTAADASVAGITRADAAAGAETGYCLVNRQAEIVAADSALEELLSRKAGGDVPTRSPLERLTERPEFAEHLERVFAGESSVAFVASGPFPDDEFDCGLSIRLAALHGASEPVVLVRVDRRHEPTAPAIDPLTRLPDRRAIADCAAAWRRAAAPAAPRFAVLFLDLDGFKSVNDSHGHAIGDAVLQTLAQRWLHCVREGDLVARYGGDEFVVLVRDAGSADEVEAVVRRLREATTVPVEIGDLALSVDVTIGWAISVESSCTIESLVAAADRDMYARKRRVVR